MKKSKKLKDNKIKRSLLDETNNPKKKEPEKDKRKSRLQNQNNKFNMSLIDHSLNNLLIKVLQKHLMNSKMKMFKLQKEREGKKEENKEEKEERKSKSNV